MFFIADVLAVESWERTMNRLGPVRCTSRPACSGGDVKNSISLGSFDSRLPSSFNSVKEAPFVVTSDIPPQADEKSYSLANWIRLIREACSRDSNSTLELARLMNQARRTLPYGSWSHLWQSGDLPFSKRKGEMLVVIGQGVGELDAQNSAHLPAAWNTLYYLARLGQRVVEQLIKQGRIHPGLSLREAKALLAEHHPETQRKDSRSQLCYRLARFAAFVREGLKSWSLAEREFANCQLMVLAAEIQTSAKPADARRLKASLFNLRPFLECKNQPDPISHIL